MNILENGTCPTCTQIHVRVSATFTLVEQQKRCNTWKGPFRDGDVRESTTSTDEQTQLVHDRFHSGAMRERDSCQLLDSRLIDRQGQDVGVKDTDLYFREFLEDDA